MEFLFISFHTAVIVFHDPLLAAIIYTRNTEKYSARLSYVRFAEIKSECLFLALEYTVFFFFVYRYRYISNNTVRIFQRIY